MYSWERDTNTLFKEQILHWWCTQKEFNLNMCTGVTHWSLVCTSKISRKSNRCFVLFLYFRFYSQTLACSSFKPMLFSLLSTSSRAVWMIKWWNAWKGSTIAQTHPHTKEQTGCHGFLKACPAEDTMQEITAIMSIKLLPPGTFSHCKPRRNASMQTCDKLNQSYCFSCFFLSSIRFLNLFGWKPRTPNRGNRGVSKPK